VGADSLAAGADSVVGVDSLAAGVASFAAGADSVVAGAVPEFSDWLHAVSAKEAKRAASK
jgi:hypothetical protein